MNAAEANQYLEQNMPPSVREEVEYLVEVAAEDGETREPIEAFADLCSRADGSEGWGKFRRPCNKLLVGMGVLVPISDSEVRESVRNGIGVKMSHFPKIDGQRYDFTSWPHH